MEEFMNKVIDMGATSGGKIIMAILVLPWTTGSWPAMWKPINVYLLFFTVTA